MVSKVWVLVALVVGAVLGAFLVTYGAYVLGISTREADGWPAKTVVENPTPAVVIASPQAVAVPTRSPPAQAPSPVSAAGSRATPPAASSNFIAGDVINLPPGTTIEYADPVHEQFVHEERNDGWAGLREAELENSLVMELSAGHFLKDRIECRASICEVELSAKGEQVELLRRWFDEKNSQRSFSPDEPLEMRGTAFSADASGAQARLTYMKPERAVPPPRNN
jgi:hypothetical protein